MSTPRGFKDRSDDSLFTLLGEVPELVKNLLTAEINSAKAWAKRAGKEAGLGSAWSVVALFFLFWLIPATGAFAIIGLSSWIPAWVASLIVVGLGLLFVAIFAVMAFLRFRKLGKGNPVEAITVDARILKDVSDEQ